MKTLLEFLVKQHTSNKRGVFSHENIEKFENLVYKNIPITSNDAPQTIKFWKILDYNTKETIINKSCEIIDRLNIPNNVEFRLEFIKYVGANASLKIPTMIVYINEDYVGWLFLENNTFIYKVRAYNKIATKIDDIIEEIQQKLV